MNMITRALDIFSKLPGRRIDEYGFGTTHFAVGLQHSPHRWRGFDFSEEAVKNAKAIGLPATVLNVRDADCVRRSYVCAIALLPNLTTEDRDVFLERVQKAPHAVFGIKRHHPSQGTEYSSPAAFRELLLKYWPIVDVETIEPHGILAHCYHESEERRPLLTIGTSTLLDFHGVTYTLASLMAHHGTFGGRVEYVVVDNHPEATTRLKGCPECAKIAKNGPTCSACSSALEDMATATRSEGARYVRWSEKQGTYPGKNQLKVEARGDWVLTMDSHVLLTPDTIQTVLDVIEKFPDSNDFFHFPVLFRSGSQENPGRPAAADFRKQQFIYHARGKGGGCYGWTKNAKTPGDPYPIAAMITSCYLVRRAAWFSAHGYDPILGNYGGWEGPIQMKWWLMGRQVLSLRHPIKERIEKSPEGFLYHWHLFNHFKRLSNATGRIHTGLTKMRNFAASSAVIGGEPWVRRHCELKGWGFDSEMVQQGMAEGLKLRPWMIENLADPEWEDIRVFFQWMKDHNIPGALETW